MKSILKTMSFIVLLAALIGGAILVSKNQETRKGATASETSASILPSRTNTVEGKNFDVHVWMNTGKDTDKLTGAEFSVTYDESKVEFVGALAQNGYQILNENLNGEGGGMKVFNMITMSEEKAGAVDLLKLTFKPIGNANGNIGLVAGAKLMISGQTSTWDVAKYFGNSFGVKGGGQDSIPITPVAVATCVPRPICLDAEPACRIKMPLKEGVVYCPQKFAGVGELCNQDKGIFCGSGLTCNSRRGGKYIDWVEGGRSMMLDGICIKGGTSEPSKCNWCGDRCVDVSTNTRMACKTIEPPMGKSCVNQNNVCTIVQSVLAKLGEGCGKGVAECASGLICHPNSKSDRPGIPERAERGVCVDPKTIPTRTMISGVTLMGRFEVPTIIVGNEITAFLSINSGRNKVSAVNIKAIFDPNYFEILSVTPMTGAQSVTAKGDSVTGVVSAYLLWQSSTLNLPTNPEFVTVKLKAKKVGITTLKYDTSYANEVSGVDSLGKSGGFGVKISETLPRLFITDVVASCMVCSSGLARSTGNANCDSAVNLADFELWRGEVFDKGADKAENKSNAWKADFNCDQMVTLGDFEIWRSTVFK